MHDEPGRKALVQRIVSHLLDADIHWSKAQKELVEEVNRALDESRKRGGAAVRAGVSEKSISAWKVGRQVPKDPRVLVMMRKVVGCDCPATADHLVRYQRLAQARTTTRARDPKAAATGEDAARALNRVELISAATADDCDQLTDALYGPSLRLRNVYVERDLEHRILDGLRGPALIAVRGEAGSGKTALMWRLYHLLLDAGRLPLLIPATSLLRGARGETDAGALTVDDLWIALGRAVRARSDPVLLVDTLDLLTHSRETRLEVRRLMRTAEQYRVPMVVACRPAEAARLHLDEDGYGGYGPRLRPLLLNLFNPEERSKAIESYAEACYGSGAADVIAVVQDAQVRGRPLREVVANPLTLRMLFELYAADGERPDPDIDSVGLYTLFRERRVVADRRDRATPLAGPDLSDNAERIALVMLEQGGIEVRRRDLLGVLGATCPAEESIDLLCGRGVLAVRQETRWLWFFHQTYFEFTAAWAVAARGAATCGAFADFVAEDPYDLFYGEVAAQMILLAGRTAAMPVAMAEDLLIRWLAVDDPGLRVLGLRTYARFRAPSARLREVAAAALAAADDRTCKDFLRLLPSISHPDPRRWQDDLDVTWRREGLRVLVIEALTRLAAARLRPYPRAAPRRDQFGRSRQVPLVARSAGLASPATPTAHAPRRLG